MPSVSLLLSGALKGEKVTIRGAPMTKTLLSEPPRPKTSARTTLMRILACTIGLLLVLGTARLAGKDGSVRPDDSSKDTVARAEGLAANVAVNAEPANSKETAVRSREGHKLNDVVGEFQKSGDRYNFYPQSGGGVIRVLENLALERVANRLVDDPASRLWVVSGVLTEYRGENFLLLTRAVLKTRAGALPPSDEPGQRGKATSESAPTRSN
jgi:hypothetical protein